MPKLLVLSKCTAFTSFMLLCSIVDPCLCSAASHNSVAHLVFQTYGGCYDKKLVICCQVMKRKPQLNKKFKVSQGCKLLPINAECCISKAKLRMPCTEMPASLLVTGKIVTRLQHTMSHFNKGNLFRYMPADWRSSFPGGGGKRMFSL